MTDSPAPPADTPELDPVYRHSLREAKLIVSVWATALCWTIPYCYVNGFLRDYDPAHFPMVLGIPSWVVWGIMTPWMVANLFTFWFCFFYMQDDDLGVAHEGADIEEEIAEIREAREHREPGG